VVSTGRALTLVFWSQVPALASRGLTLGTLRNDWPKDVLRQVGTGVFSHDRNQLKEARGSGPHGLWVPAIHLVVFVWCGIRCVASCAVRARGTWWSRRCGDHNRLDS
jgi:hypothetical protein